MPLFARRLFIFLDEWLGILLLCYLRATGDWLFWPVLIVFVIAVYWVAYRSYWEIERWSRGSGSGPPRGGARL